MGGKGGLIGETSCPVMCSQSVRFVISGIVYLSIFASGPPGKAGTYCINNYSQYYCNALHLDSKKSFFFALGLGWAFFLLPFPPDYIDLSPGQSIIAEFLLMSRLDDISIFTQYLVTSGKK